MNNLIVGIGILLFASVASAETKWEAYLAYPTPGNAALVTRIEYTPDAIPAGYGYWAPDLAILRNQVLAGDSESFKLAYRLSEKADGGLLEELTALLGHVVRSRPEFFLKEITEIRPTQDTLGGVLLMVGEEYTDREKARKYELRMRRKALAAVKDNGLRKYRDICIAVLDRSGI